MTLREAVEAIRHDCPDCGHRNVDDRDRARAIVDAAVEAHEAREAHQEVSERFWSDGLEPSRDEMHDCWDKMMRADDKLRALERGEEA